MNKLILLFTLALLPIFSFAKEFDGKLHYSEATDVFVLMDYVSGFKFSKLHPYRAIWEKKHPLSLEDKNLFREYIKLRQKYYKSPKLNSFDQSKLLFSHVYAPHYDFVADCFYTSRSVSEAFKKLKKRLTAKEIKFFVSFFKHFQKSIASFVQESRQFQDRLKSLNKDLKKYKLKQTIKKMAKFLGVARKNMSFQLFFVWWPDSQGPQVTYGHNVVLLHYNPISQMNQLDFGTIAEMLMKTVIYRMGFNQKQNLTKRFFQICNPKGINAQNILEKPLMVLAGKVLTTKNSGKKKEFNLYQQWDENPWVDHYVKVLYPALEQAIGNKENISVSFIQNAAMTCSEIVKLIHYTEK